MKKTYATLTILIILCALSVGLSYVSAQVSSALGPRASGAYSAPTGVAPVGNRASILTVSSKLESKAGKLDVYSLVAYQNAQVEGDVIASGGNTVFSNTTKVPTPLYIGGFDSVLNAVRKVGVSMTGSLSTTKISSTSLSSLLSSASANTSSVPLCADSTGTIIFCPAPAPKICSASEYKDASGNCQPSVCKNVSMSPDALAASGNYVDASGNCQPSMCSNIPKIASLNGYDVSTVGGVTTCTASLPVEVSKLAVAPGGEVDPDTGDPAFEVDQTDSDTSFKLTGLCRYPYDGGGPGYFVRDSKNPFSGTSDATPKDQAYTIAIDLSKPLTDDTVFRVKVVFHWFSFLANGDGGKDLWNNGCFAGRNTETIEVSGRKGDTHLSYIEYPRYLSNPVVLSMYNNLTFDNKTPFYGPISSVQGFCIDSVGGYNSSLISITNLKC